jgi:hypothetical protein
MVKNMIFFNAMQLTDPIFQYSAKASLRAQHSIIPIVSEVNPLEHIPGRKKALKGP